jgi:hypothetical protein
MKSELQLLSPASVLLAAALLTPAISSAQQGTLEVPAPNSVQSGIGAITGWHCAASRIDISIDGGPLQQAGSGTSRLDTLGVCGRSNTGFSLLFNWNTLPVTCFGCRFHHVTAYADGEPFADTTFEAENFRTEFLTGKTGQYGLPNFPELGSVATLRWDESMQNFAIYVAAPNQFSNSGTYRGAVEIGAHNPACGPFPPNRVLPVRYATFDVAVANNALTLAVRYADGSACTLAPAPVGLSTPNDGYLRATYDATATAACTDFAGGLNVQFNGERLVATSRDNCVTGRAVGAK